ncbi:MAG: AAA family ATPase [Caulobacteraceae bacterium]
MRTIAVIARKGGSGKTTIAVHLAIGAHLRGRQVLLADTDPQRSALEVLAGRPGPGPESASATPPALVGVQMAAVRARFEALVIDTPAGAEEHLACALVLADLALLVLRPTFLDLAAAAQTLEVARRLRKPILAVLNQAPAARQGAQPPSVLRALKALELLRLAPHPIVVRSRLAYQLALESGRSAEELDEGAAASEMGAFVDYLDAFALRLADGGGAAA